MFQKYVFMRLTTLKLRSASHVEQGKVRNIFSSVARTGQSKTKAAHYYCKTAHANHLVILHCYCQRISTNEFYSFILLSIIIKKFNTKLINIKKIQKRKFCANL